MILKVRFPENLVSEQLVLQEDIPCLCKISKEFEIEFQDPLPEAVGVVVGWDRKKVEDRAPAGAGGQYTHYAPGRVTLRKTGPEDFQIVDLSLFYYSLGWCPVFSDCEYAIPKAIWDEE